MILKGSLKFWKSQSAYQAQLLIRTRVLHSLTQLKYNQLTKYQLHTNISCFQKSVQGLNSFMNKHMPHYLLREPETLLFQNHKFSALTFQDRSINSQALCLNELFLYHECKQFLLRVNTYKLWPEKWVSTLLSLNNDFAHFSKFQECIPLQDWEIAHLPKFNKTYRITLREKSLFQLYTIRMNQLPHNLKLSALVSLIVKCLLHRNSFIGFINFRFINNPKRSMSNNQLSIISQNHLFLKSTPITIYRNFPSQTPCCLLSF